MAQVLARAVQTARPMDARTVEDRGVHLIELRGRDQRALFINGHHVASVVAHPRTGRAIVALSTGEKIEVDHDPREVLDALAAEPEPRPVSRTFSRPVPTPYRQR